MMTVLVNISVVCNTTPFKSTDLESQRRLSNIHNSPCATFEAESRRDRDKLRLRFLFYVQGTVLHLPRSGLASTYSIRTNQFLFNLITDTHYMSLVHPRDRRRALMLHRPQRTRCKTHPTIVYHNPVKTHTHTHAYKQTDDYMTLILPQ